MRRRVVLSVVGLLAALGLLGLLLRGQHPAPSRDAGPVPTSAAAPSPSPPPGHAGAVAPVPAPGGCPQSADGQVQARPYVASSAVPQPTVEPSPAVRVCPARV
jgi:hypothetical protein